ncbi:hypothetical protein GCM10020295_39630 [Streptomyces cinereospinus]
MCEAAFFVQGLGPWRLGYSDERAYEGGEIVGPWTQVGVSALDVFVSVKSPPAGIDLPQHARRSGCVLRDLGLVAVHPRLYVILAGALDERPAGSGVDGAGESGHDAVRRGRGVVDHAGVALDGGPGFCW